MLHNAGRKKGMKIKINIIMCWVMLLNVAFGRVHGAISNMVEDGFAYEFEEACNGDTCERLGFYGRSNI